MTENPYQPPKVSPVHDSSNEGESAYQDALAERLVITKDYEPPKLCMFTGEEALAEQPPKKVNLRYVPLVFRYLPAVIYPIYLALRHSIFTDYQLPYFVYTVLFILIIFASHFFQKKTTIYTYYGPTMNARQVKRKKLAIGLFILGALSLMCLLISAEPHLYMIITSVLVASFSLSAAISLLLSPPKSLKVTKFKNGHFYLKGVHSSVLDQYPLVPDKLPPT